MTARVVFIDIKKFSVLAEEGQALSGKRVKVCPLTPVPNHVIERISRAGVGLIDDAAFENERDRFIKEYVQLMARVGDEQKDPWWWATDFSSKIVFKTDFPQLMEKHFMAVRAIETGDYDTLYIVGVPWMLWPGLAKIAGAKLETPWRLSYCFLKAFAVLRAQVLNLARVLAHSTRSGLRAFYARRQLKKTAEQQLPSGDCLVIRSNVYNHSFGPDGPYKDIFFGELVPRAMAQEPCVVVADVMGNYPLCVRKMRESRAAVIPWEYFLTLRDLISYTLILLFWRPRKVRNIVFEGHDIASLINDEFARTAARIQPYQFFQYPAFLALAKRLAVTRLFMVYEGNAWCKMVMMALRLARPGVKVIGYQHTVVPQAFGNMYVAQGEYGKSPLPDILMTVGEETKNIIERYSQLPPGVVRVGCALRMAALPETPCPRRKINRILVALEGVETARDLVQYTFDQLAGVKDYKVAFRFHPVLPEKHFRQKWGFHFEKYENFEISKKKLKEDLIGADVVLYQSTAVSLEALGLGKPLVHLHNGMLLSLDPLFDCPHLKWVTRTRVSLGSVLDKISALSDGEFRREQELARAYLRRYFHPVEDQAIQQFLST